MTMEIGAKIRRVKSCSSTNDLAKKLAYNGEEEGMAVVSAEQTKGKGTKGRSWFSAREKGLYLSVILHPPHSDISLLPLMAGVSVCDAIFKSVGLRIRLKWPNDVIWGKKKLGGILCESSFLGSQLNYVILGIGLNVSHRRETFPEEIRHQATSLKLITKVEVDKKALLGNLWPVLNYWYGQFLQGKAENIVRAFQENSVLAPGKDITVITEGTEVSGTYQGIDLLGGLILETRGERRSFFSAEIKTIKSETKEA